MGRMESVQGGSIGTEGLLAMSGLPVLGELGSLEAIHAYYPAIAKLLGRCCLRFEPVYG